MEYVLKDIRWYYTSKGFVPHIVNKDRTKIKLLTNDNIYKIIDPVAVIESKHYVLKFRNGRKDRSKFAKYKLDEINLTLEKVVGEKGVMVAPFDVFNYYYFINEHISYSQFHEWLNSTIMTTEQIKELTKTINANKLNMKKVELEDISNNSKQF